jgi:hypothetical protein
MSTTPIAQGPVDVNVSRHFGEEKFNLHILRYMDGDGLPTCAADFPSGRVCIFYATQRFGCNETCWFAEKTGKHWHVLRRRKNGEGTLIPDDTFCPVWANALGKRHE